MLGMLLSGGGHPDKMMGGVYIIFILVLIILGMVTYAESKIYASRLVIKLQNMKVAEGHEYLLKKKEDVKAAYLEYSKKLKKAMTGAKIFALLFVIYAVAIDLLAFPAFGYPGFWVVVASTFYLYFASLVIQFAGDKKSFKWENYVDEKDFPILYALARRAAKEMGVGGIIKIAIVDDNIAIGKRGKYLSLQIGTELLCLLNEDELYNILLHEFAHVNETQDFNNRVLRYYNVSINGRTRYPFWGVYSGFDTYFVTNFTLSRFICNIITEQEADEAMKAHGEPVFAASALIKTNFRQYYEWEKNLYDTGDYFESEEIDEHHYEGYISRYKSIIEQRKADWLKLTSVEIISRSASHPTLKMRLDALGFDDCKLIDKEDSPEFAEEKQRVIAFLDRKIYEDNKEKYKENRERYYLKDLSLIEKWKKDGRPVTREGYSRVLSALMGLHRLDEALALCDEVIASFDDSGACYADYIKGCYLLAKYDPAGVDLIYTAIDSNKNYLDEGLAMIGEFCCLTGNQELLDDYRERALDYAQNKIDVYDKTSTLSASDNIAPNELSEEEKTELIEHIKSADNGIIDGVYCIRKIITEAFDTTPVIVRFKNGVDVENKDEFFEKLFQYLDKCSSRQFSLFEYEECQGVHPERIEGSLVYSAHLDPHDGLLS